MACVLVPDLPVAAALRIAPELRGTKLGITSGPAAAGKSVIVAGFLRGLSVAQAQTLAPDLRVYSLSLEGLESTHESLVDAALSISPRVESVQPGHVYVDLAGSEALFPSDRNVLTALGTRLERLGFEVHTGSISRPGSSFGTREPPALSMPGSGTVQLGIGPTCTVAHMAALHRGGGHCVVRQNVRAFLAPLPLDLLDPPDQIFERMTRWGVHTLGDLMQIPHSALGTRLGPEAVRLARRAAGEDLVPMRPMSPRLRFEESHAFELGIESLEALGFALRGALERLGARLRLRGFAARELWLELDLEGHGRSARRVELGAPAQEAATFLSLVRLALERDPPSRPVEGLRIIATPDRVEPSQLDLFLPPPPAPAELAMTLARLEALCGSGHVGCPGTEDSHLPDSARFERFLPKSSSPAESGKRGAQVLSMGSAQAATGSTGGDLSTPSLPRGTLALRVLRPPQPVLVRERDGRLASVALESTRFLRVLACAGPWRLFGEWWGERCFARDYFDVELSDAGIYRLYHNLSGSGGSGQDSWFLDGIYD